MTIYTAHILTPTDWPAYQALRLEAVKAEPASFYLTHEQESSIADSEWIARCTETSNDHCGFGLLDEKGQLVASVEIMRHDQPKDNQCVLGRFYIKPEHRGSGAAYILLGLAVNWASEQGDMGIVIAAARNDNDASKSVLEKYGFKTAHKDGKPFEETFTWPATGELTTQTWYGYDLEACRPYHRPSAQSWRNELTLR